MEKCGWRVAASAVVLGTMLVLSGCGGSGDGPTPPAPLPPPPTTTTVFNQGYSVLAGAGSTAPAIGFQDVTIPNTGDVVVTFDWTAASSDVDLVVTPPAPTCASGVTAYNGGCTVHGSDKSFAKPARVSFTVTSPGVVRIWVYNFATVVESGVLNVTLTR